jgi:ankyrin repeat protein
MKIVDLRFRFVGLVAILIVLGLLRFGPEPAARSPIPADEFIRAMAEHRASLIDFYLSQHFNPNARGARDRPLILAAAMQQDWGTARRLLKAGASVDLADEAGETPLMEAAMCGNLEMMREFVGHVSNIAAIDRNGRSALHYAIAAQKIEAVELLLLLMPDLKTSYGDGRDLLALALDTGNRKISGAILNRLAPLPAWTTSAQRALGVALRDGDRDQIRLLLKKHATPPTPEGKNVPLLAYAVAQDDAQLFRMLLECGADPNTAISGKYDKEFLALLPSKTFRNYIEDDKNVTALMLAAGLGRPEYAKALLEAGADRSRATARYKMLALYYAAETGNWRCTQILLGGGPPPERLRIEISLASQHVALIKDGVPVFNTICSTGRSGYSTRRGDYVITDKDRNHWSTIYKVEMPYFMRLSCLDFGMHEGVVPNYPASHGCIRLPSEAAHKFFAEIPIGTLVTVQ